MSHRLARPHRDVLKLQGDTVTTAAADLPDYAPVPPSSLGPALNDQGYYVGRVERNLFWVTDGTYQSAFLTTRDGVVLFDAPPTIGHNLRRAVDEMATAEGVTNTVTHLVYSHHHDDHTGASSLFDSNVVRIGHEETRRLLLRDNNEVRCDMEFIAGARAKKVFDFGANIPDPLYGTSDFMELLTFGLYKSKLFRDFVDGFMAVEHAHVHQALMEGSSKIFAAWERTDG